MSAPDIRTLRAAFWKFGGHVKPCPLEVDINLPDSVQCTCGFDKIADALIDEEEASEDNERLSLDGGLVHIILDEYVP